MEKYIFLVFSLLFTLVVVSGLVDALRTEEILLKSRHFIPPAGINSATKAKIESIPGRVHVLIQLEQIPTVEEKRELEGSGIKLLSYVPNKAWFASIPSDRSEEILALSNVMSISEIEIGDKLAYEIREGMFPDWSVNEGGMVSLLVEFFKDVNLSHGEQIILSQGGNLIVNALEIVIPKEKIHNLSRDDNVKWMELTNNPIIFDLNGLRPAIGANTVQAAPYNLDGTGVTVLVYDEGEVDENHDDFGNRVTVQDRRGVSYHSTHVAGIVGGDGTLSNGDKRGVATNVNLVSDDFVTGIISSLEAEYYEAVQYNDADLATNSWHDSGVCGILGTYTSKSQTLDEIVRGSIGPLFPVIFAAGNTRNDGCGNYGTIPTPQPAKNILVVGATNSDDDTMTDYSAWGPVDDGRIKPEVVAPGDEKGGDSGINSTIPNDGYGTLSGTSMAAPAVAGSVALMFERWRNLHEDDPWPSTIKAILLQTPE